MNRRSRLLISENVVGYLLVKTWNTHRDKAIELFKFLNYTGGQNDFSAISAYGPLGFNSGDKIDLNEIKSELEKIREQVEGSFDFVDVDSVFEVQQAQADVYIIKNELSIEEAHWFHSHLSNLTLESEVSDFTIPVFIFCNISPSCFSNSATNMYLSKIKLINNEQHRGAA